MVGVLALPQNEHVLSLTRSAEPYSSPTPEHSDSQPPLQIENSALSQHVTNEKDKGSHLRLDVVD